MLHCEAATLAGRGSTVSERNAVNQTGLDALILADTDPWDRPGTSLVSEAVSMDLVSQ